MIIQYLQDNGYTASYLTIQDETNVKMYDELQQRSHVKAMRAAILGI
jgi:COMPASS component SWD3